MKKNTPPLLILSVHGWLTETKLLHRTIYINIKKYQNRVSLKERASFFNGLIIIRSSHFFVHETSSERCYFKQDSHRTWHINFNFSNHPPSTVHLLIASLTQTSSHIHTLILKTNMALKQKIIFYNKSMSTYLYPIFRPRNGLSS